MSDFCLAEALQKNVCYKYGYKLDWLSWRWIMVTGFFGFPGAGLKLETPPPTPPLEGRGAAAPSFPSDSAPANSPPSGRSGGVSPLLRRGRGRLAPLPSRGGVLA